MSFEKAGFPVDLGSIMERVGSVDPNRYAATRNFVDGAVTRLSPYISRGVISTRTVFQSVIDRGYKPRRIQKFIQELAWREYYQRTWQAKGDEISEDIRQPQENVANREIAASLISAATGIEAVDGGIEELYSTGYMHNHVRMYTASIACNIARSHWKTPARWMYYHLFDGDWASNAISWQWVAGSASNKKYFANQENINKFCFTKQTGTFLDAEYSDLETLAMPEALTETEVPDLPVNLTEIEPLKIDASLPTVVYNSYNLDPMWHKDERANRVLLLEPSHFEAYPVSGKVLEFIIELSGNIDGVQVFCGEFDELQRECAGGGEIFFKEHPLFRHYQGTEESREWMFDVTGHFPSFFAFWKKCERRLSEIY